MLNYVSSLKLEHKISVKPDAADEVCKRNAINWKSFRDRNKTLLKSFLEGLRWVPDSVLL